MTHTQLSKEKSPYKYLKFNKKITYIRKSHHFYLSLQKKVMPKHCLMFLCSVLFLSCKSTTNTLASKTKKDTKAYYPLHANDSVAKFENLKEKIIFKTESQTSFNNPVTQHFKKFISKDALKEVNFQEWRKNIYVEFTVDRNKQILHYSTNTSSKKLDLQIRIAFKSFEFEMMQIQNFDPIYKYSLVVVQNINNTPVVKCNSKAIGYAPPVFSACSDQNTYEGLNHCNYMYITDYLYNNIDLSTVNEVNLDNNMQIYPRFIVDKHGKVVAAKIESKNKELVESYYKAIKNIPDAVKPAKLNDMDEFYGYNFPTSITNVIKSNHRYKKYASQKHLANTTHTQLMKRYVNDVKQEKFTVNY